MKKPEKKNIDKLKPVPSEFDHDPECLVIFAVNNLMMGRIISKHKGEYITEHQGELVIFNANIVIASRGKIWYGDINVTQDFEDLKNIADKLGEDLYILMENDARWGTQDEPVKELMQKARTVIKCKKCLQEKK